MVNMCVYIFQQAANIVRALELFVKPDVLSGENAYMCAKWVAFIQSDGVLKKYL